MGWLDGQVALVTGGGSGLGLEIVRRFIDEGAKVGVLELSPTKIAELRDEFGDLVACHNGDATRTEDNEAAVELTRRTFGHLDVLVANVGMWDFETRLTAMSGQSLSDAFEELFTLNVKAPLLAAKSAQPALAESGGSMIFTLSNAAFHPGGGGVLYTSSKHALVGVVRQLAHELAPQIRVNGVAPGGMRTDLRGPRALGLSTSPYDGEDVDQAMREWSPLRYAPEPRDYVGHYVLLAARAESRTVTGAIHVCDGGAAVRG